MGRKRRVSTSGKIAKYRTENALVTDYLEISSEKYEQMCRDLSETLSRYIDLRYLDEIQLVISSNIKQGDHYVKTIQIKGL